MKNSNLKTVENKQEIEMGGKNLHPWVHRRANFRTGVAKLNKRPRVIFIKIKGKNEKDQDWLLCA